MEGLRKSADWEVVGIVEPDAGRRARAEKSAPYEGLKWMTEEELLNTPGLQAVAVETDVKDLLATAGRCIAAGKHLHLDKPAGEDLAAYRQLLSEATKRKLVIQMGYMFRYNPAFLLGFQLLREGALGDIFEVDAVMSKKMAAGSRSALLPYRGGIMFELGCHVIDAVITVLGRPDKVTPYNRAVSGDGFLDNQLAVFEYPKATVTVRSSLAEVEGGSRRQFVMCGTKGTYDIHPLEAPAAKLALEAPYGKYKRGYQDIKFPPMTGRYDGDLADLAKVIRGEKPFEFTPEHDLIVQETVMQASGKTV